MRSDAIILAAGYSSRTDVNKLTLNINQYSILARTIETFYPSCEKIIVVGGHYYADIKEIVKKYSKVLLVKNEQYHLGMFSSVKRGVAEVKHDFFITPGDYPLIKSSTCDLLKKGDKDISVPIYNQRKGHPIFLKKKLIPRLLEEPITSNLKLFRDKQQVAYIDVKDEGVLIDIDTMDDYLIIKKRIEGDV